MPQVASFPFTFIGKTKLGIIYRPYAVVLAFSKIRSKWQPLEMIIDTGADYTLLPKRYAGILGINLSQDCIKEKTLGIGGTETVYQYKNLPVKINKWQKKIPVGFLKRDNVPPLLGRLECLEIFRLIFHEKKSLLEVS